MSNPEPSSFANDGWLEYEAPDEDRAAFYLGKCKALHGALERALRRAIDAEAELERLREDAAP